MIEISDLNDAFTVFSISIVKKNVRWLDISMDNLLFLMQVKKAIRHQLQNAFDLLRLQLVWRLLVGRQVHQILPRFLHLYIHFEVLFIWIKFLKVVQVVVEMNLLGRCDIGVTQLTQSHYFFDAVVVEHSLDGLVAFHLLQCDNLRLLDLLLLLIRDLVRVTRSLQLSVLLLLDLRHFALLLIEILLGKCLVYLSVASRPYFIVGVKAELLGNAECIVEEDHPWLDDGHVAL